VVVHKEPQHRTLLALLGGRVSAGLAARVYVLEEEADILEDAEDYPDCDDYCHFGDDAEVALDVADLVVDAEEGEEEKPIHSEKHHCVDRFQEIELLRVISGAGERAEADFTLVGGNEGKNGGVEDSQGGEDGEGENEVEEAFDKEIFLF